jgi:hypothetical protein
LKERYEAAKEKGTFKRDYGGGVIILKLSGCNNGAQLPKSYKSGWRLLCKRNAYNNGTQDLTAVYLINEKEEKQRYHSRLNAIRKTTPLADPYRFGVPCCPDDDVDPHAEWKQKLRQQICK